jgi:hypothetical protein
MRELWVARACARAVAASTPSVFPDVTNFLMLDFSSNSFKKGRISSFEVSLSPFPSRERVSALVNCVNIVMSEKNSDGFSISGKIRCHFNNCIHIFQEEYIEDDVAEEFEYIDEGIEYY